MQPHSSIPYGFCHCGCGQKTNLAPETNSPKGWIKGQPLFYLRGHSTKGKHPVMPRESPEILFWSHVKKTDNCWEWQAFLDDKGYGSFKFNKRNVGAHRASWELTYGPIPKGMFVCHKCDNPRCVRPDHLFLGTQKQNIADMYAKGRQHKLRGEACGAAKLTQEQVDAIRQSYAPGLVSVYSLAKVHHVSPGQIHRIVTYQNWRQGQSLTPARE